MLSPVKAFLSAALALLSLAVLAVSPIGTPQVSAAPAGQVETGR